MMDVVSYFKSLDLSQDKDTPFIAKGSHEMFKHYFNIEIEKEGYKNRILNVSPGSIKGTKFNGGENDFEILDELAQQIIDKME
ncbi:MAG: hypothetical protein U0L55_06605, partial [Acutalibacteraceae bacterium]|nr:hypothetical protein [Acutalibacteraceae bacterium]